MSTLQNEKWLDAALDNFGQAIYEGNYVLCKDIIADVQEVNLEAGRTLNEMLRDTPVEKFLVKSPIQPYNPAQFVDVVDFLNKVNKALYGIEPFTVKLPVKHYKYEHEVVVNGVECDLCHTNEHADLIRRVAELDICDSCYEHYN